MRSTLAILAAVVMGCGGGGSSSADAGPDARVPAGFISVAWTINFQGAPSTCAAVGNPPVTVTAQPLDGVVAQIDTFSCSSMMGTTRAFPVGRYNVTVSLGQLDDSDPFTNVMVEDGRDTNLGSVAFDVTANATLQFKLDVVAASGSNCEAEGTTGGAGITDFYLELGDSTGTCIPTTFHVGATDTYTNDCTGAAPFRCIEADETIQVTDLVFGSYRLTVQGHEGDVLCDPYTAALNASTSTNVSTIPLAVVEPIPDGAPDGGTMMCANP